MRMFRKALAVTAVAGAFTVSLLAGAAPASAEGTNASGWYTGYGSSSIDWVALQWAENDARWRADLAGFNTYTDCHVSSRHVTKLGEFSYSATVELYCYNFS
ncbi:hypothetical protein [Micromonospora inyonensis]|uniref:Bacteriocin (Lactococcin_972) n=1 Tax=Micromonospora inyonensis TaxID=47866 RepID=A0A1C6R8D9_9ACTN|nr:hypothetical protein [Micromonospora inyonensis]SCL13343.1 hypothetical protein GA0074694_0277 [Micromonospora inyonensis]